MNKRQLRFDRGTLLFLLTNLNVASRLTSFISPANSPGRSSFCASGRRIEIESPSVLCFLFFFFSTMGIPFCPIAFLVRFSNFFSLLLFFIFIVSHQRNLRLLSFVRIRFEQSDDRFVEWIVKKIFTRTKERGEELFTLPPKISCAFSAARRSAGWPAGEN